METPELAAVFVLVFAAACVQAFSGFGFGLLIVPLLVAILDPRDTVVTANMLGAALAGLVVLRSHGGVDWGLGARILGGSLLGMPAGLAVLLLVRPETLQVLISVAVVVSALALWRGLVIPGTGRPTDVAVGAASGALRMSVSMSGPPVVLYFQGMRMAAAPFRSTISAYFAIGGVAAIGAFAVAGQVTGSVLAAAAAGAPGLALGLLVGERLQGLASEALFRHIVLAILVASALGGLIGAVV